MALSAEASSDPASEVPKDIDVPAGLVLGVEGP